MNINSPEELSLIDTGLREPKHWNKEKSKRIDLFVKSLDSKRTSQQKMNNVLRSIQYQIEDYILTNKSDEIRTADDFLKSYLSHFNISQKTFAGFIEMKDSNLKKYLTGERKFNLDLAMKFSRAFSTPPDLWLKLQVKNELLVIAKEKKQMLRYKKYESSKLLRLADL